MVCLTGCRWIKCSIPVHVSCADLFFYVVRDFVFGPHLSPDLNLERLA